MKLYITKAVAAWLDLSESRVRQLRKEKVITEYKPELYSLQTVTHEYINYLRANSPTEASVDYNTERAKLVRAKRETKRSRKRAKRQLKEEAGVEEEMEV